MVLTSIQTYSVEHSPQQQQQQHQQSSSTMNTDNNSQETKPRIKVKLPLQPGLETKPLAPTTAVDPVTSPTTESISATSKRTDHGSAEVMPEDQFKRCEAIVNELKKPKYKGYHWPFLKPVDADAWGASDYYDIIKHPMDMTTYERKLYGSEYSNEEELAEDIRLMFRNCYFYNPPHHLVHGLGKEFEAIFEKQWAKLHNSNGSSKKSSKHHSSKKRRILHTVDTPSSDITSSTTVQQQQQQQLSQAQPLQTINSSSESSKNDPSSSSIKISNNSNNNNQGRSTILRLKLNGPNLKKEEDQAKVKIQEDFVF